MDRSEHLLGSRQECLALIHKVRQNEPAAVLAAKLTLAMIDDPLILAEVMEFVYQSAQRELETDALLRG
jgi:hypothetical protein